MNLNAYCHSCGAVFPSAFSGIFGGNPQGTVVVSQNAETCPNCGGMAETQNVSGHKGNVVFNQGNSPGAVLAFEVFQARSVVRLKSLEISKLQAKRFEDAARKAIAKKDGTNIRKLGHKIDPNLGSSVDDALRTKDPKTAIQWLMKLVRTVAFLGGEYWRLWETSTQRSTW